MTKYITDGNVLKIIWGDDTYKTITATPSANTAQYSYRFKEWKVLYEGRILNPGTETSAPTIYGPLQITAVFERINNSYTVTTSVNNGSFGTVTAGGTYDYGSKIEIKATPKEGYEFVKWQVNGVDDTSEDKDKATRTITVTKDETYTAIFEKVKKSTPVKGDVIEVDGRRFRVLSMNGNTAFVVALYDQLSSEQFNTKRSTSYFGSTLDRNLNDWYDKLKPTSSLKKGIIETKDLVQYGYDRVLGITSNYFVKGIANNGSIYYIRGQVALPQTQNRYVFALDIQDVVDYLGKDNLTADGLNEMFYLSSENLWLRSSNSGSALSAWIIDGTYGMLNTKQVVSMASMSARPAFNIDLSKEGVEYEIVQQYTITASVNDESMGSVTNAGTYPVGSTVTLTAKPKEKHKFVKWSDGNTDNPRTITVTKDETYAAVFEKKSAAMLSKGDIISMYGNTYKVLKNENNGEKVLLFSMTDYKTDVRYEAYDFNIEYDDWNALPHAMFYLKDIDSRVEGTDYYQSGVARSMLEYYNNVISATPMKDAIVKTTLRQNLYGVIVGNFVVDKDDGYDDGGDSVPVILEGHYTNFAYTNRHYAIFGPYVRESGTLSGDAAAVFALDAQDIADYFGEDEAFNLTEDKLREFLGIDSSVGGYYWLSSASLAKDFDPDKDNGIQMLRTYALSICLSADKKGSIAITQMSKKGHIRPAFYIDLTKDSVDFTILQSHTITTSVNNGSMGSVTGGGAYDKSTQATLTAIPNTGYRFVKWSDGNTQNLRNITVTDDATYTAVFEKLILPVKGDVIVIDDMRFRVLSMNGNTAFVTAMFNASESQVYGVYSPYSYDGSQLDRFLENDWYANLNPNSSLKKGIVQTSIVQGTYVYDYGTPKNNNYFAKGTNFNGHDYYITNTNINRSVGNRHVFALDLVDIVNYFGRDNMFEKDTRELFDISPNTFMWLRSDYDETHSDVSYDRFWGIDYTNGLRDCFDDRSGCARPSFNIDLSKAGVEFEIENSSSTDTHSAVRNINSDGVKPSDLPIFINPTINPITVNNYYESAGDSASVDDTIYYKVIVQSNAVAYGTVTGGGSYAKGVNVEISAIPEEGHEFVKWQINGVDDTSDDKFNPTRTIQVSGKIRYTAVFK